jgi:glycogen debranching enzyme
VNVPQVSCIDGNTFLVSDMVGDAVPDPERVLGLFYRDVRHLSTWQLAFDGRTLDPLSTDAEGYRDATFFLTAPGSNVYDNATVSVFRRRTLGEGGGENLQEELRLLNSGEDEVVVELSLRFDADFADLFEVKDKHLDKKGSVTRRVHHDRVQLTYRREDFVRSTVVQADGALLSQGCATYLLHLAPGASWRTDIRVSFSSSTPSEQTSSVPEHGGSPNDHREGLDAWLDDAPDLETGWDDLHHTYMRSLLDLAALRLRAETLPDGPSLPAAGLPWFMAVFGRDSLITSYQALPFAPQLARTTLQALASRQATQMDDFRDAEPGKILHELRFGELTYFHERPQSPYYGSADSTPLFLILLDEYERWSGDSDLVSRLEPQARAALEWVERYGDLDGDGYIEYQRRNTESGLVNQCWKDSWNSVVHPDGRLASQPRGTCELQGYAYDARVRTARLARDIWDDPALAERLEHDAATLKTRFNADFWVEAPGFFALALDGDKNLVPTLTSNMGQLLWSGIVDDSRVDAVVRHLMADPLFSGWGVRTLATGQDAYNPLSYHDGTVWPHDNALIAAGLARYGRHEEAGRIAQSVLEATPYFGHRLPEVFAGYSRADTRFPVQYPTACSPQAWAAGAPLLLLRVLLGMRPDGDHLTKDPHVPDRVGQLALRGVPGRWGHADVEAG